MIEVDYQALNIFLNQLAEIIQKLGSLNLKHFNRRIANIENTIDKFYIITIRGGLIGITSSGKSSLLNILLGTGKKILKEQSKATTNTLVFCSKAKEPQIEIEFINSRVITKKGDEVFTEPLWMYTSEDENPKNAKGIRLLRVKLPTFMLGDNVEVVDTPGIDAYGYKEHEDLTLREFLPQADLVFYLTTISSPMKEADKRVLNQIMDSEQKIIFVQTCKGSIVPQPISNGTYLDVETQLNRLKKDFHDALLPYARLINAPVVQVETSEAYKSYIDGNQSAWQQSGMEEFLCETEGIIEQIKRDMIVKRLHKIKTQVNDLSSFIKKTLSEEAKYSDKTPEYLSNLADYYNKIKSDMDMVLSDWNKRLNYSSLFARFSTQLYNIFTYRYDYNPMHDKEFLMCANSIREEIIKIKEEFLSAIDNKRDLYGSYFKTLSLDIRRQDIQEMNKKDFFMPNVQKKRLSDVIGPKKSHVRLSSLLSSKDSEETYIDKNSYINELKESLRLFCIPLVEHLKWWQSAMTFSFLEPLKCKINAIEEELKTLNKDIFYNTEQQRALKEICGDFDKSLAEIDFFYTVDGRSHRTITYSEDPSLRTSINKLVPQSCLFIQLGSRLFENIFHSCYMRALSNISNHSRKKILLIGDVLKSQFTFLRLLMRLSPHEYDRLAGLRPPFSVNLTEQFDGIPNLDISGELDHLFSFILLDNKDKSLECANYHDLFEKTEVIQFLVDDLHRVSSAMSDMTERNAFYSLMMQHKKKLMLSYSNAAYFNKDRLHLLASEVLPEFEEIFFPDTIQWFIYENYEVRYNYFIEFSKEIIHGRLTPIEGIANWKRKCISLDELFSENILLRQFELCSKL